MGLLLPLLGWLRLAAERHGLIEHSIGIALLVCASMLVFGALTLSSAWLLRNEASTRRAAEKNLRRSEEQFRQMAEMIAQLAWIAKADG